MLKSKVSEDHLKRIENVIADSVRETVSEHVNAINHNLKEVIGGLLYSLKLEYELDKGHCQTLQIDELIDAVVNTSAYTERPDQENYPIWDEGKSKKVIDEISKYLQKHGIQQSWNIRSPHNEKSIVIHESGPIDVVVRSLLNQSGTKDVKLKSGTITILVESGAIAGVRIENDPL